MNVLLTCIGRRGALVEAFRRALDGRGRVVACDSDPDAPALRFADESFVAPPVEEAAYVDALLDACRARRIGLIVPAFEPELVSLSDARGRFLDAGAVVVVSSKDVVALCHDKLRTGGFLEERGIESPRTVATLEEAREALAAGALKFPLIVKPRWGVSSIETEVARDAEELELVYRLARKRIPRTLLAAASAAEPERSVLVQQHVAGTEYGLDIVNDLDGRHVNTLVKRKIRMRAGQTDRAVTCADASLQALGRRIGEALAHVGVLDCDVIVSGARRFVLDLNPRMGGGYPFSHVAGADVPAALLAWASGEIPDPEWLAVRPDVRAARFDGMEVL